MSSDLTGRREWRSLDEHALSQPTQPTSRLLTLSDLCLLLKVSKSTAERMIRSEPTFPQPRKLRKSRLIRFVAEEVHAYLAALPCAEYDDHAFDPNDRADRQKVRI